MVDKITRPRWLARAVRWAGRRGLILILCGVAWMVIGTMFTLDNIERFSRPGPGGPLQFLDSDPWPGLVWVICGSVAGAVGTIRRRFGGEDAFGFAALVAPCVLWFMGYLWSYILFLYTTTKSDSPEEVIGRAQAGPSAIVYLIILAFLFVIARWPDPIDARENARRTEIRIAKGKTVHLRKGERP